MKYFLVTSEIKNDRVQVSLDVPFNYLIGIVDIMINDISKKSDISTELTSFPLQINCNQIDSNFLNVKKVLRRFLISKKSRSGNFFRWESSNDIVFQKIDSQNNFLTFDFISLNNDVIFKDQNSQNSKFSEFFILINTSFIEVQCTHFHTADGKYYVKLKYL